MAEENTPLPDVAPAQGVKPARSHGVRWAVILLAVAVVAGAGWYAWYAYDTSQIEQGARDKVDDATTLIEDADTTVLDVDEVVRAEVTTEVGEQAEALQEDVPVAIEDLKAASVLLEEAIPELPEEDVAHARALIESADARVEMLSEVDVILEANVKAAASLDPALDAWAAVLEGERIADESIAEYNKLTDESVKTSLDLTAEALVEYEEAKRLFSLAATGFPEADFSGYTAYVDGKIELLGISKQANEAFIAGDKGDANDYSDQYNAKDKELVTAAEALPATPGEVVAGAYDELAGAATDAYFEARERAMLADEALEQLGG